MTGNPIPVLMPSEVSSRIGFFDRFAGLAAKLASRAPFFAFCLLLVILWLVQGVTLIVSKGSLHAFLDSQYQLEINTTTTIVTFLMVALLQNSQTRTDQAVQHKLNAIADGLADLMEHLAAQTSDAALDNDTKELRGRCRPRNEGRHLTQHEVSTMHNDATPTTRRFTMAGTSKQVKGKANKVAGSAKKAVGKATKDRSLQAKGSAQKAKGTVQDVAGKVEEKVRGSGKK